MVKAERAFKNVARENTNNRVKRMTYGYKLLYKNDIYNSRTKTASKKKFKRKKGNTQRRVIENKKIKGMS